MGKETGISWTDHSFNPWLSSSGESNASSAGQFLDFSMTVVAHECAIGWIQSKFFEFSKRLDVMCVHTSSPKTLATFTGVAGLFTHDPSPCLIAWALSILLLLHRDAALPGVVIWALGCAFLCSGRYFGPRFDAVSRADSWTWNSQHPPSRPRAAHSCSGLVRHPRSLAHAVAILSAWRTRS